ncbi:hypothetical protein [Streptomyces niger]|uniref:hypothetical protein n=1 Tax=Streptomyces niger TaxID=66373 RepID=UPI000B13C24D|nr:hypothetical protein [Streptomyces niger]
MTFPSHALLSEPADDAAASAVIEADYTTPHGPSLEAIDPDGSHAAVAALALAREAVAAGLQAPELREFIQERLGVRSPGVSPAR